MMRGRPASGAGIIARIDLMSQFRPKCITCDCYDTLTGLVMSGWCPFRNVIVVDA
jgi:hypothetical protein